MCGGGSRPGRRAPQHTFLNTLNTFTLPSFAAPGFRRMKMARATTSTMVVAAAAVVVTNLARRWW